MFRCYGVIPKTKSPLESFSCQSICSKQQIFPRRIKKFHSQVRRLEAWSTALNYHSNLPWPYWISFSVNTITFSRFFGIFWRWTYFVVTFLLNSSFSSVWPFHLILVAGHVLQCSYFSSSSSLSTKSREETVAIGFPASWRWDEWWIFKHIILSCQKKVCVRTYVVKFVGVWFFLLFHFHHITPFLKILAYHQPVQTAVSAFPLFCQHKKLMKSISSLGWLCYLLFFEEKLRLARLKFE